MWCKRAQQLQAIVPVSKSVLEVYQGAIAHGYSNENITGVAQYFVQTRGQI